MTRKLLSDLIPQAESYLANSGCGSGTNYTSSQVAGLMASFALKVLSLPPAEGAVQHLTDEEYQKPANQNRDHPIIGYKSVEHEQQPTAEGAEEIAQRCPVCNGNGLVPNGFYTQTSGHWSSNSTVPETCRSCNGTGVVFATLYAQRIADKMVKDMRQKLFSMRSSKEAMDKLSEAYRLMMYGYHDCINEMLMWTKSRER